MISRTASRPAALSIAAASIFQAIFLSIAIAATGQVFELGTSTSILILSACAGVCVAAVLSFTRLRALGFLAVWGAVYTTYSIIIGVFEVLPVFEGLSAYLLSLHFDLMLISSFVASILTWIFWRWRHGLTVQIGGWVLVAIALLSGHRNFHFESPKVLNDLAWSLGASPLVVLISVAVAISALSLLFLYGTDRYQNRAETPDRAVARRIAALSVLCLLGALLFAIGALVHRHFNFMAQTRAADGVGFNNQEHQSPLGFHSALGGSNQPSAIVRLEGDYSGNPYSPMLYLRESALSEFNGREMVNASAEFDRDVNRTSPDEPYTGAEDPRLENRTPIVQSVFLLASQPQAFAVDVPLSIRQLKNPNPGRFRAAYRAYSMAPSFGLEEVSELPTGDPDWTNEERQLYLSPHPDLRYQEVARKASEGETSPVRKALAVSKWLSKNAIYTLTPGHEPSEAGDPVAPFLFGDMRGYCVHFAHATVYMLRSLGIPARVATGYLTDLSQSRDGHILLRMSDRHAWAEVYISNRGWLPFDIKPERVESHAETPVDMRLLEDLMAMLGPGEEILPKDVGKDEAALREDSKWQGVGIQWVGAPLAIILFLLIGIKIGLRAGWILCRSPRSLVRWCYLSLVSELSDLGVQRRFGETREEFRRRVSQLIGKDPLNITPYLVKSSYSRKTDLEPGKVRQVFKEGKRSIRSFARGHRRLRSVFSPRSVFSIVSGEEW